MRSIGRKRVAVRANLFLLSPFGATVLKPNLPKNNYINQIAFGEYSVDHFIATDPVRTWILASVSPIFIAISSLERREKLTIL